MSMPPRQQLLQSIAAEVTTLRQQLQPDRVLRVAIDGVDGAGKTTFANELAQQLQQQGAQSVIRASVDGFHQPRAARYHRQGRGSAEGFYNDSYNYTELQRVLLDPLGPGGSRRYRTAIFDVHTDSPVSVAEQTAAASSILLFDGIFLHRPELMQNWDFSIFLDVCFDVSIPRCAQRSPGFGSADPLADSNRRYVEGQQLYLQSCEPHESASLIISNDELAAPTIIRRNDRRQST